MEWLTNYWLDIVTTILDVLYIILEYRASILLWVVGIIMPALDIILFWQHGLYGDSVLAIYYLLAAIYGYIAWKISERRGIAEGKHEDDKQIVHMPLNEYFPMLLVFLGVWWLTWFLLSRYTNSTVPVMDAFTNALSIIGMWALSRKYVEQWLFWIIVDGMSFYLYLIKEIPFKATLYGVYVIIAVGGFLKWAKMADKRNAGVA